MPENYNQGEEIIVGNRRLRKVKRPKQHATPISVENPQNSYIPQMPQNPEPYMQETPTYMQNAPQEYDPNIQNYDTPGQTYENTSFTYDSAVPQPYVPEEQPAQNVPQFYQPQMNTQDSYPSEENYVQDPPYSYAPNPQTQNILYGSIDKKKALFGGIIALTVGIFIGSIFFGGGDQVVQNGLQGVVVNPEVPKGRARCGVAEKMQGCVLYVMNPQRQELNGRDFYDLASQLTGRQRFVIETGNMRYSSVKIRPGAIAQLNIPPLQ